MKYVEYIDGGPDPRRTSGVELFRAALSKIAEGAAPPFPYYAALLYTLDAALDVRLHRYVRRNERALNAVTATNCLLFIVASRELPDQRASQPEDVIALTRLLGARMDSLPCAVFFVEPATSTDTLVVRLDRFFPAPVDLYPGDVARGFRAIGSALESAVFEQQSGGSSSLDRLAVLKRHLTDAHRRTFPELHGGRHTALSGIKDGASTLQSIASAIEAFARLFG